MDYQIARNIRNRSLADVIAANLVAGESYSGAFTRGVRQKSAARFTAIKEKFDPLNIIKFMTGGSNLAPALLGRMLGRSQRDIQYFAGTARPIGGRTTYSKIGALPQGEGGSNLEILSNIYKFLKTTQESEKRRFDSLNSKREEEELEKEKRHNELISAITGISRGGATVPSKPNASFFDSIVNMLKGMFESFKNVVQSMIDKAMEWINVLKPSMANLMKLLGSTLLNPFIMGAASMATALAGFLYFTKKQREEIQADPFNKKYDDNAYARFLRGEAKSEKQAGEQIRRETVRQMPKSYIESLVGSNLSDSELIKETGKNRSELMQWLKNNPKPSSMFKSPVAPLPNAPKPETNTTGPTVIPRMTPQQLESVVKENQALNLPKAPAAAPVNNLTNVSQTQKNQSMIISKLDKLSVRNPEETFQRMIYYSTRVV